MRTIVKSQTFLDEVEASKVAWDYIEKVSSEYPVKPLLELDTKNLQGEGGSVITLFWNRYLIVQAVIIRDPFNRSILNLHDYRK